MTSPRKTVVLDGHSLTIEDTVKVAREKATVVVSPEASAKMRESYEAVRQIIEKEEGVVYGINTGLGELEKVVIDLEKSAELQRNLLFSHSAAVGPEMGDDEVRAMLLHRANALARGHSGVRPHIVETLVALLNRDIVPVVGTRGSVGASGDLAPLAQAAMVLVGRGKARTGDGKVVSGEEALKQAGIKPIKLGPKEGLALINGTQYMTGAGSLAIYDIKNLLLTAEIATALSFEALGGIVSALDPRIISLRPHPGQMRVAEDLWRLLADSKMVMEKGGDGKHQDAYTLRCAAQVYGACLDAIDHSWAVIEREINSATDNPLIVQDEKGGWEVISGGNFHGEPVALALDYAGMAATEVGSIQERTIFRLLDSKLSGLPPFLTKNSGLNSGFMIAQYTAAALLNECKILSHPASTDSIPTSASQEDHVSMGATSANKLRQIRDNLTVITAIHLLTAAQAVDLRLENLGMTYTDMGKGTAKAMKIIRKHVPLVERDDQVEMRELIEKAVGVVEGGELLGVVRGMGE